MSNKMKDIFVMLELLGLKLTPRPAAHALLEVLDMRLKADPLNPYPAESDRESLLPGITRDCRSYPRRSSGTSSALEHPLHVCGSSRWSRW